MTHLGGRKKYVKPTVKRLNLILSAKTFMEEATLDKYVSSPLYKVIVDEVFNAYLVRLLVAQPDQSVKKPIWDASDGWLPAEEIIATEQDALNLLGLRGELIVSVSRQVGGQMTSREEPQIEPWRGLHEGQVFLVGKFRFAQSVGSTECSAQDSTQVTTETPAGRIVVDGSQRRRVLRIDTLGDL